MTWNELVLKVVREGNLKPSRVGPIRTAAQQYIRWLEVDPDHGNEHAYVHSDDELHELIATRGAHLSRLTQRNIRSDIRTIFRLAIERGWIERPRNVLMSWKDRPHWTEVHRSQQYGKPWGRYRLGAHGDEIPKALADDLEQYLGWCTVEFMPKRDRRVKKRAVSSEVHRTTLLRVAGFAVYEAHLPAETITLQTLTDPLLLEQFVVWWIQRRGRVTASVQDYLAVMRTVATHWVKDKAHVDGIIRLQSELPEAAPVRDKRGRWLTLREIDQVAENCYPLNERRVLESYRARRISRHLQNPTATPYRDSNMKRTAVWAEMSILLKIWIRCPVRQRCWREAELGHHVTKLPDGGWLFRWTGTELKVAMRKGHPNEYTYRLDEDLRPRFEEYLQVWRPLLAAPDERHLWLGAQGQPFTTGALRNQVVYTTQRFGGKGINPHLIRDIFASELLANGASIHDVARALGDVMKTVYDKYAHTRPGGGGQGAQAGGRVQGTTVGRGTHASLDESIPARIDPLGQASVQRSGVSAFGLCLHHA
jgi:hypothetical protein